MSQNRAARVLLVWGIIWTAVIGVIVAATLPIAHDIARALNATTLHTPNWGLIARADLAIQWHVVAAVVAFAIGLALLIKRKGTGIHRALGWIWVVAMGVTAASSLFITGLNGDSYSLIHLLTGWTLIALPMALVAIRQKKVIMHKRMMTGLFVGGLVAAGAFTFIPGRLMWEVFFG